MEDVMKIRGKPVKDATERLEFEITAEDIEKGEPMSQTRCAAALAIARTYKDRGCLDAGVCRSRSFLEYAKYWVRYVTPISLRHELIVHDRDGKMEKGKYYLTPNCVSQKPEMVKAIRYIKTQPDMTDQVVAKKSGVAFATIKRLRTIQTAKAEEKKDEAKKTIRLALGPVSKREQESRGKAHTPRPANRDRPAEQKRYGHGSQAIEPRRKFQHTAKVRPVGVNF